MASSKTPSGNMSTEGMMEKIIRAVPQSSQSAARKNIPLVMNALKDEGILTPNVLAYAMATIQQETAGSFSPVNEGFFNDEKYGYEPGFTGKSEARKRGYKGGENYFGRGFIQLTNDFNYKKIGQELGMGDALFKNPDLALNPEIAAKIFARYFKSRGTAAAAEKGDFIGARKTINSKDYKSFQPIAESAKVYQKSIGKNDGQNLVAEGYQHIGEGAYYKRDPKNPEKYDLVRTGQVPPTETPTPTPYDATGVAPVKRGLFGRPGADASISPAERLMRGIVPNVQAAEPNMSRAPQGAPIASTQKRSYTQQYAQEYNAPYTVKPGDTLWGIAERTLGSGVKWKELGHQGDPKNLKPGTPLKVPAPPIAKPMQMTPAPRQSMPKAQSTNQPYLQASSAQVKPIQSSAAGGNFTSRLVNSVTNLFKREK